MAVELRGYGGKAFANCSEGPIYVRIGVSRRNEQRFKLGRREKNTAIEHSAEEFGEALCVAFFRGGIIRYRVAREE